MIFMCVCVSMHRGCMIGVAILLLVCTLKVKLVTHYSQTCSYTSLCLPHCSQCYRTEAFHAGCNVKYGRAEPITEDQVAICDDLTYNK